MAQHGDVKSQFNIQLHNDDEMECAWGTENFFELQPSSLCLVDDTSLQAIWIQSFNTCEVLNIQAHTNWYENLSHCTLSPHCHHPVMTVNT